MPIRHVKILIKYKNTGIFKNEVTFTITEFWEFKISKSEQKLYMSSPFNSFDISFGDCIYINNILFKPTNIIDFEHIINIIKTELTLSNL